MFEGYLNAHHHELVGTGMWNLGWDRAIRRLGCCRYNVGPTRRGRRRKSEDPSRAMGGTISISTFFLRHPETSREQVSKVLLHELAHVIAGRTAGHGQAWREVALRIGADAQRCGPGHHLSLERMRLTDEVESRISGVDAVGRSSAPYVARCMNNPICWAQPRYKKMSGGRLGLLRHSAKGYRGRPMLCRYCGSRCELVDAVKHWRQLDEGDLSMRETRAEAEAAS